MYSHDLASGIFHGGQAEPDAFPLILIFNKVTGSEKTGFLPGCRRKDFSVGREILLYLFPGDFDNGKKTQYFNHATVGNVGDGIASCGKKGVLEAVNVFHHG